MLLAVGAKSKSSWPLTWIHKRTCSVYVLYNFQKLGIYRLQTHSSLSHRPLLSETRYLQFFWGDDTQWLAVLWHSHNRLLIKACFAFISDLESQVEQNHSKAKRSIHPTSLSSCSSQSSFEGLPPPGSDFAPWSIDIFGRARRWCRWSSPPRSSWVCGKLTKVGRLYP